MVSKNRFDMAGASDVGRTRAENQDHFLIADLRRQLVIRDTDIPHENCDRLYGSQEGNLLVVADGMGGHQGGERASRTAIEETARYVLDMMHWFLKLSPDDEQDFVDELSASLKTVQERIWSAGGGPSGRQMGTTVTMAYLLYPKMYVVHAGDSRCYLFRDGTLRQLTTDHTVAQQMIDAGALSKEDAAVKRWRHVLWNCVGGGEAQVRPEAIRCKLGPGDVVLLCSDGLSGMLDDPQIEELLASELDSPGLVDRLIAAANEAGGSDNISAIICRVSDETEPSDKAVDPGNTTTIRED